MKYNRAVSHNNQNSNDLMRRLKARDNKVVIINNNNRDMPRVPPKPQNPIQKASVPSQRVPPSQRKDLQPRKVQDSARAVPRNPNIVVKNNDKKLQRQEVKSRKEPRVSYLSRAVDPVNIEKARRLRNNGQGKILAIIGNGPSINDIDLRILKNRPGLEFLSINHPDPRIWPTDYWAFFDQSQANRHAALWDDYNGTIFNSVSIQRRKLGTIQFRNLGARQFSKNLTDGICIGRSSVFAAMQIALWMDFYKIYIFGVDMNPSSDLKNLHFYGTNPDVLPETRAQRFEKEAEYYMTAWDAMTEQERSKFVFCSSINPWPFMKHFQSRDHRLVIPEIISEHEQLLKRKEQNG